MLEKYGWEGISTGLRLQRGHLARMVQRLDALDQNYLKMWLDFIHKAMYSRGVLDDKTRLLVMVGNCLAMDEEIQGENHMRCALFLGATPREIFEVILQTTLYIGMPKCIKRIWVLERILQEHGRLGEITETQLPLW
jgi:alkylhydroperoxidase/carboxymuconolactone decarboxylase family protein YurZ